MNPTGRNGLPEACKVCNSIYHFRRECPDLKRESPELNRRNDEKRDSNGPDIIQYAYFVGCASDMEYNDNLVSLAMETKGYAILDSGCPNTVCGKQWMNEYIDTLSDEDRKTIRFQP